VSAERGAADRTKGLDVDANSTLRLLDAIRHAYYASICFSTMPATITPTRSWASCAQTCDKNGTRSAIRPPMIFVSSTPQIFGLSGERSKAKKFYLFLAVGVPTHPNGNEVGAYFSASTNLAMSSPSAGSSSPHQRRIPAADYARTCRRPAGRRRSRMRRTAAPRPRKYR
jgi:hypothetical protein